MYFHSISPFFVKMMSSSGKVRAVNRIQHICNTVIHKSPIYGLFRISKCSQRDNLRNLDLRSNLCFTRVCGVVRCGEKRWNLLGSQRICNTFATKISKKYRTLFGDRHWRVSFLLCRFCVGSYAVLIF